MEKGTIAVFGATGAQGGGVVNALAERGKFKVRAITRNPEKYKGRADEAVKADLNDPASLEKALQGVYGVFLVTNFWEGADEYQQGTTAINAAKKAQVKHFVWSTLPNVKTISGGKYLVPHFTHKAEVDGLVKAAGFSYYTFVQAPYYFQNLTNTIQEQADGTKGWALPIDPASRVVHMADINDLGKVVAGAFENPQQTGNGAYLSLAAGLYSFNEIVETLNSQGHPVTFRQVPAKIFNSFFEGAQEFSEMLAYFEEYSYMGPNHEPRIKLAREVATGPIASFADWARQNFKSAQLQS